MAWLSLLLAGLLEVVWAIGLKYSQNFTKLTPSIITLVALVGSFLLLAQSMRSLPVGTAYAVWTGIGAVGATIVGIIVFKEPAGSLRLISLGLIIIGIIGLKFGAH
ncbi:multidrug transporter [Snodgrassella communis]|jgi:quaternary ammonium compound-resistance protein SugE|uniref:Guanidinium exporter n=1 Tax=Snodgrassella communis TaxID=2946699 RepID=A0A836MQC2_9NEIS|nr:quaternary ammonium compound efflux SMR transporter SugE [Snodgrassella communis]KDN14217.1 Quaternary ammonium compound-resistance protein SugE [Snodgrassella communis]PIT06604.1 multidrug transporter [Snodgrassella communis]PIT25634.1 multidrug transporter [Snodgrassella communis]PIT27466.1 multidrug transporter [Snodgrassella communis]PIT33792.1 multidrug transporter [Snodgrassella communis]